MHRLATRRIAPRAGRAFGAGGGIRPRPNAAGVLQRADVVRLALPGGVGLHAVVEAGDEAAVAHAPLVVLHADAHMGAPIHQLHGDGERRRGLEADHRGVERHEADRVPRHYRAVDVELEVVVRKEIAGYLLAVGIDHHGLQLGEMIRVVARAVAGVVQRRGIRPFRRHDGHLHALAVLRHHDAAPRRHESARRTATLGGELAAGKRLGGGPTGEKRALDRLRSHLFRHCRRRVPIPAADH